MSNEMNVPLCLCGRRGCLNPSHAPLSKQEVDRRYKNDPTFDALVRGMDILLREGIDVPTMIAAFNLALEMAEDRKKRAGR